MTIEQELIKTQSELNTARHDLAESQDKLSNIEASLATITTERDTLVLSRDKIAASLKTEKEGRAADLKSHGEALTAKDAEVEKRANLKLHERATQLGIKPVKDDTDAGATTGQSMNRKDFFKLSPNSQMQFMKYGGRLVD